MSQWDDEDFELEAPKVATTNDRWSGEDEEDIVKDNWDDDDEEEKKPDVAKPVEKKKKPLAERIAEREAKKKAELEEKRKKEQEANKVLTVEELAAEKERLRLQEEEEQLMLAKDLMGVSIAPAKGIDAMKPTTVEEFTAFGTALKDKITQFQSSPNYSRFLEDLFRDVCASMNSEGIKKLGSALNTLSNEKLKMEKAKDGKKKKAGKKGTITQVREKDYDEGQYDEYDEFDDFM